MMNSAWKMEPMDEIDDLIWKRSSASIINYREISLELGKLGADLRNGEFLAKNHDI